jgi:hypothetical protein
MDRLELQILEPHGNSIISCWLALLFRGELTAGVPRMRRSAEEALHRVRDTNIAYPPLIASTQNRDDLLML